MVIAQNTLPRLPFNAPLLMSLTTSLYGFSSLLPASSSLSQSASFLMRPARLAAFIICFSTTSAKDLRLSVCISWLMETGFPKTPVTSSISMDIPPTTMSRDPALPSFLSCSALSFLASASTCSISAVVLGMTTSLFTTQ